MHTLFLVSSMHGGGAERVAATLANAWVARGDRVTLVCCYSGRGICLQPLDDRVKLLWLADQLRGPALFRPISKLLALRRLARRLQPDRVLSFLTNVNVSTLLASRGLQLPVVVSERTDPAYSVNLEPALRYLRRLSYPWAHQVVVQTAAASGHLKQVAPRVRRIQVIPNPLPQGLPPARQTEPAGPRFRLVALGRFNPVKQFDRLIAVFATLAPQFPDWDLCIWGDGAQRQACQAQVDDLGLSGRVQLPGFSTTPWQDLLTAHVFVLSSRVEGFPNALLEAMALGLPCVALDCPSGPAELTQEGAVATLVPLDDDTALVAALRLQMQASPAQRTASGQQAAASVRARYGLPAILQAWDALWTPSAIPEGKHATPNTDHGNHNDT
ncbi:glycosyltransferase family 4 protein [Castellaniella sp.]|uniref:glycosyltransferase family 4 protein n=1 Tax=Castellaniella sp. TaxID=1955812 RepID=UPI003C789121